MKETEELKLRRSLETISIRARMAFAVSCILLGAEQEGVKNPKFVAALELLMAFTASTNFYDWDTRISSDLGYVLDLIEDLEENRVPECPHHESDYADVPIVVLGMLSDAAEIGLSELYGGLMHGSPQTLELVLKIYRNCNACGWPTPQISAFHKFSFDQESGWGSPISRDDEPVSAIWRGITLLR